MDINVYEQYFAARHPGNGTPRRAVLEALAAESGGEIFWDRPLIPARLG